MRGRLGDRIRLMHILDAIMEIESYLEHADLDAFLSNSMMRFASIKQLEIIGEAGNHISQETKDRFESVEWAQIVGMRNIFVHEYFGVDASIVWQIIQHDLPELRSKIEKIISTLE